MLPTAGDLDELLRLEARIAAKIVAAGVFDTETKVLEGDETEQRVYADLTGFAGRLEDGDTSLLAEGDEAGGAFAGEELRALLLRAFTEGEIARLRSLPWGVGAVSGKDRACRPAARLAPSSPVALPEQLEISVTGCPFTG